MYVINLIDFGGLIFRFLSSLFYSRGGLRGVPGPVAVTALVARGHTHPPPTFWWSLCMHPRPRTGPCPPPSPGPHAAHPGDSSYLSDF